MSYTVVGCSLVPVGGSGGIEVEADEVLLAVRRDLSAARAWLRDYTRGGDYGGHDWIEVRDAVTGHAESVAIAPPLEGAV